MRPRSNVSPAAAKKKNKHRNRQKNRNSWLHVESPTCCVLRAMNLSMSGCRLHCRRSCGLTCWRVTQFVCEVKHNAARFCINVEECRACHLFARVRLVGSDNIELTLTMEMEEAWTFVWGVKSGADLLSIFLTLSMPLSAFLMSEWCLRSAHIVWF